MADDDPWAEFRLKPEAATGADPWAEFRVEQTPSAHIAEDFASLPKGFFERLSEGEYPTLYNPKTANLLPGPTGKPPQMHGMDLPAFGVGMGEAPGVTLGGAAAPFAPAAGLRSLGAAGRVVFGGHEANAAQWLARLIAGGAGEEVLKSFIRHLTAPVQ